jgi:4-hydroxybenzoyl-CoA thioesterase
LLKRIVLGTVRSAPQTDEGPMLSYSRTVEIGWGDCDASGLIHTERYFALFDGNMWIMLAQILELPLRHLLGTFGAAGFPTVDLTGKFLAPSTLGDKLEVETTILELRKSSFSVRHRALKDGDLRAESMDTRVWVRRSSDDPAKIEALPLPAKLVERFRAA